MATAPAKPNPNAPKPKQNLLMIGGIMLALGSIWFIYDAFLRPLTDDEIKDLKEQKAMEADHAREAAREEARHQH